MGASPPAAVRGVFFLCAVGLFAGGCPPRVALTVPRREAPLAERVAAYKKLRPTERVDTILYSTRTGAQLAEQSYYMLLANGEQIFYVEDLLGAVAAESQTAEAVARYRHHGAKTTRWLFAILGATAWTAVGGGVGITLLSNGRDAAGNAFFASAAISLGLTLPLAIIAKVQSTRAQTARTAAFEAFDGDLRENLGLCEAEGELVDCAAPPPAPRPAGREAAAPGAAISKAP
jgi:hypothetical protein